MYLIYFHRLCDLIVDTHPNNTAKLEKEILGGNAVQMEKHANPVATIEKYLSDQRSIHPVGLIGFKWKPVFTNEKFDVARRWLAQKGIRVILMERNILDIYLSNLKRRAANVTLPAHCKSGDDECINNHKSVPLVVDTKGLMNNLVRIDSDLKSAREDLEKAQVPFFRVSYDILAYGADEERLRLLQDIVYYIYSRHHIIVTMENFKTAKYEATHERNHSISIKNYVEVVKVLSGTPFASLLH
jgi:hypothetical protein